jgi:uncharacterized protein YndB with AHSA1/START domain
VSRWPGRRRDHGTDPAHGPGDAPDELYMIHLDGRYHFPADPDQVWATMSQVERFPTWWRWLRDFDVQGHGLSTGGVLSGLVVPPIPYRFHVSIHLAHVAPGELIVAALDGDLHGPATLSLEEHPEGTELAIRWDVEMRKPSMRSAAHVAKPLLVWGHDQVIEITVRRFRSVVLGEH